jgi:hypothetical protein
MMPYIRLKERGGFGETFSDVVSRRMNESDVVSETGWYLANFNFKR